MAVIMWLTHVHMAAKKGKTRDNYIHLYNLWDLLCHKIGFSI